MQPIIRKLKLGRTGDTVGAGCADMLLRTEFGLAWNERERVT